ncbi:GNAT family N-acetyltransferase [Nonomuraea soli]|uniref:N-acetyltransferase domain-containing protein n=1 Tax=Nonomuraea soli TaxID=1032476 RepID=A0A7W0HU56_9ACTN|nr:GNAT family N-acetyltransferase [Nonomuraea soli]MBA2895642.1 hypothetical protein [Nonomuraea soli]
MSVDIKDNPAESRFEIFVDGRFAGFAEYTLTEKTVTFTHTEIYDDFEGQGLAGKLVAFALDASRDTGLKVRPLCPYVARFIGKRPEYQDLVEG